nr:hypothetical protein [Frankia umida]
MAERVGHVQEVRTGVPAGLRGAGVASLYGFAAPFQRDAPFGRILAAYGGIFVAGSLLWSAVADGCRQLRHHRRADLPDRQVPDHVRAARSLTDPLDSRRPGRTGSAGSHSINTVRGSRPDPCRPRASQQTGSSQDQRRFQGSLPAPPEGSCLLGAQKSVPAVLDIRRHPGYSSSRSQESPWSRQTGTAASRTAARAGRRASPQHVRQNLER